MVVDPLSSMPSMAASTTCAVVQDDEVIGVSSGAQLNGGEAVSRKRRHSFFLPRRKSIVEHIMDTEEGLFLKVRLRTAPPPPRWRSLLTDV